MKNKIITFGCLILLLCFVVLFFKMFLEPVDMWNGESLAKKIEADGNYYCLFDESQDYWDCSVAKTDFFGYDRKYKMYSVHLSEDKTLLYCPSLVPFMHVGKPNIYVREDIFQSVNSIMTAESVGKVVITQKETTLLSTKDSVVISDLFAHPTNLKNTDSLKDTDYEITAFCKGTERFYNTLSVEYCESDVAYYIIYHFDGYDNTVFFRISSEFLQDGFFNQV